MACFLPVSQKVLAVAEHDESGQRQHVDGNGVGEVHVVLGNLPPCSSAPPHTERVHHAAVSTGPKFSQNPVEKVALDPSAQLLEIPEGHGAEMQTDVQQR